jgi:hypothetical protein
MSSDALKDDQAYVGADADDRSKVIAMLAEKPLELKQVWYSV